MGKPNYLRHVETGDPIPGCLGLSWLQANAKLIEYYRDPIACLRRYAAVYGPLWAINTRRRTILFVTSPEIIHKVHTDTQRFVQKPFLFPGPEGSYQERFRMNHLFNMHGEKHRQQRRFILPAMQRESLVANYPRLISAVEGLIASWHAGRLEMYREMQRWTGAIAMKVMYGVDDEATAARVLPLLNESGRLHRSLAVRALPVNLPFLPYRRLVRIGEMIEAEMQALIEKKRAQPATDVLSLILQAQADMTADELLGHVTFLFSAAFESTSVTLAWILFLVAQHPQIYAELVDELDRFHDRPPACDELERLPLLDRVIKEAMRILPAVVFSRRRAVSDCVLGGYLLPANTNVTFSHYLVYHSADIFPEPERFRPERWKDFRPGPGEYFPFGIGPRYCLGAPLALMIVKTALAMILPRWRLSVVANARISGGVSFIMYPRHGIPMFLAKQDRRFQAQPVRGNIHNMVQLTRATATAFAQHKSKPAA